MVRAYGEWRNPCVTIGENEVRIRFLYMFGSEDAYFNETTTQLVRLVALYDTVPKTKLNPFGHQTVRIYITLYLVYPKNKK